MAQLTRTLTAGAREHCAVAWLLDVRSHGLDSANRRAIRRAELIAHLFNLDPKELT